MGITAHVLILAGAAIDHNPLYASYPLLPSLTSATRATPEKLSTLRRLHIKLAVRVATPSRYAEPLRAR